MATALCNQCDKITDVLFKEEHHPNNVQETYFKCEHCHYRYTCFVIDTKVRKMQRKIRSASLDNRLSIQEDINNRMGKLKYNLINFGRADL